MNIEVYNPLVIDIHRTRDRSKIRLRPRASVESSMHVPATIELVFQDDASLQAFLNAAQAAKDKALPEAR